MDTLSGHIYIDVFLTEIKSAVFPGLAETFLFNSVLENILKNS